jgi:hypothetical protein
LATCFITAFLNNSVTQLKKQLLPREIYPDLMLMLRDMAKDDNGFVKTLVEIIDGKMHGYRWFTSPERDFERALQLSLNACKKGKCIADMPEYQPVNADLLTELCIKQRAINSVTQ